MLSPAGKACLLAFVLALTIGVGTFTYFYTKYARITDARLRTGVFTQTSLLYSAPRRIMLGDPARGADIAAYLRSCQYSESNTSRAGWYRLRPDAIEINPGPDGYEQEGAVIKIQGGRVTEIISLRDHSERNQYFLEPELVTNLFDRKREKRRIVHFDDIPPVMIDAVLSAEDKHFFQHAGFDPFRIVRAGVKNMFGGRLEGASTLTMQLARTLWLSNERTWGRKIPEVLITLHLEQKLTKKQIFEDYANSIYLGNHGSFSINGFGEGAQFYFGKDLSQVTLPEAALLAGLPQNSSMRDPFRFPERAKGRRNTVLALMRDNGKITERQYEQAAATPVKVIRGTMESSDAPYFVDLVNEDLQSRFQDPDFANKSYRVYTTLDPDLQRDAVEAVRTGIVEADNRWKRRSKLYGTEEFPLAQVALIALDAETGKVLALVGGRNYGASQLNHAVAKRQPGSSFKPFVYTAAMETGLENNGGPVLTPATTVVDEPTTFYFDNITYTPRDFEKEYMGTVTLRTALAHSLNVSAVKVAQMAGFDKVAQVAHRVGLNADIKPTPSIALGAYEVMPIEIASAYTVFPNGGKLLKASLIDSIHDQQGATVYESHPEAAQVIDPRVTYLVEQMMEEVMRSGTGAGVRARGFKLPAAGKTGTSHDGWFAGFTSKIVCVVWMGFDDNRDFKLQGADSALPIWVEFMKRAHQHSQYRNVHPFEAPDGVVTEEVDADTGEVATNRCPRVRSEVFIAGTQPVQICHLHGGGGATQVAGWEPIQQQPVSESGGGESSLNPPVVARANGQRPPRSIPITPSSPREPEKKKGFWQRLKDAFQH
ncbi:MAG: PBP1A family penicillin-binding protein [Bryobacterales bacterium]|nr:PBP1A family penicillin-binding protein [Bryobacterales bacterium]MBV9402028.1 PBP1A family penicillin-binding protein [Bryobacterales bacterium]